MKPKKRPESVLVVIYNDADQVLAMQRQDDPTFWQSVTGSIELGETPLQTAIREVEEETGYRVDQVRKVFEAYMSPGSVTEKLYFFVATYDAQSKVTEGGGVENEGEDIEVLEIPIQTCMEMIQAGEIKDGKTIMLLQYAKLNVF